MSNLFEIIVIAIIVIVQFFVAIRIFRQINIMNCFLPEGRSSLKLEEYEIPAEEILGLDPSDIVGKIAYSVAPKAEDEEKAEEKVEMVARKLPKVSPANKSLFSDDLPS